MKTIVLAMLFSVMQASPPIPREAADKAAQTTANIQSKGASNQEPSPHTPSSVKTDGNGPAKADSSEPRSEDQGHDIGISKLPPVTVNPSRRDLADWSYLAFSGLLVIVGGLQVWLLYGTLRAIQRQAGIMADNIDLIINKERMRISVEVLPLILPAAKEGAEYENCSVSYIVRYSGATRAVIVASSAQAIVTDSPEPNYAQDGFAWSLSPEAVIEPFTSPGKQSISLYGLSRLIVEMIENRKSFVHFFGYIKYRDFFERERETAFSYRWRPRAPYPAIGMEGWKRAAQPMPIEKLKHKIQIRTLPPGRCGVI